MVLDNMNVLLGDAPKIWSPSDIDDKLQLSTQCKNNLKIMPYKEIDIFETSEIESVNRQIINLKYLVGACRNTQLTNWLDALYKLRKKRHFDLFHSSASHEVFVNRTNWDDIPEVYDFNGEYYIHGNGLHRLTIAKCLGIQTAYARVLKVKSSSA